MLKQSPLAKDRDKATIEEVAIWLDMNKMSARTSLTKMLKAIDKNYHSSIDQLDVFTFGLFQKILQSQTSSQTPQQTARSPFFFASRYFSDNALYWLFKLFSETSAVDGAILDKKFIDFSKKMRDGHKSKSVSYKFLGSIKLPIPSKTDQALYEVFAELVDILERKLTKRHQSLLS